MEFLSIKSLKTEIKSIYMEFDVFLEVFNLSQFFYIYYTFGSQCEGTTTFMDEVRSPLLFDSSVLLCCFK